MAENTAISWADDTFNPWIGCTKVSPACDGCYAENLMALRHHAVQWGPHAERKRTSAANWAKPLAWDRKAAAEGKPRFVFCASLADVFDNAVDPAWRRDLFDLIRATPNLTWLLLTKRPGNIVKLFLEAMRVAEDADDFAEFVSGNPSALWPRSAAIGCTVVTQEEADRDVPKLLAAKAALNPTFAFVSMEPLLGPVDLRFLDLTDHGMDYLDALTGERRLRGDLIEERPWLDWVITGGETDQGQHKARPSHPDWFRSLRDQCAAADVAYHHKQNGEFAILYDREDDPDWTSCGKIADATPKGQWLNLAGGRGFHGERVVRANRVGKKAAGRLLDGVTHDARPEVAP